MFFFSVPFAVHDMQVWQPDGWCAGLTGLGSSPGHGHCILFLLQVHHFIDMGVSLLSGRLHSFLPCYKHQSAGLVTSE